LEFLTGVGAGYVLHHHSLWLYDAGIRQDPGLIPWLCFWWQGIEVLFKLNREEEEEDL
jgi:hypothetical protein